MAKSNRFTSKTDAMNRRVHWWVCLTCDTQYPSKEKQCQCGSTDIQYFPSTEELNRYRQLQLELRCGLISNLELQPAYPIVLNGIKTFTYKADFKYTRDGSQVIEDVKGSPDYLTDVFKLKRKVVEAVYGIRLIIV